MKQQKIMKVLQEYHTPAYVFDLDALARRLKKISSALKQDKMDLCYAMKANPFLTGNLLWSGLRYVLRENSGSVSGRRFPWNVW